jgi:hypothetical protein
MKQVLSSRTNTIVLDTMIMRTNYTALNGMVESQMKKAVTATASFGTLHG